MAAQVAAAKKPRLKNLDDLFGLNENEARHLPATMIPLTSETPDTELALIPFAMMEDFPCHPFRPYEGERRQDLVESIRDKGILQPLILRALEDGRYHILAGHNRKYCGIEAGLEVAPAIVKYQLTDEEAWIYVIETNLMQRSFTDMCHSEKAAVISLQHSKLFSQGKRNDIIEELKELEKAYDSRGDGTCAQVAHRLKSRDIVANQYGLSKDTVARYLRIQQLTPELKKHLDEGEIAFIPAVTLSFLREGEQKQLDKCIELNDFKVDMRKAEIMRDYSARDKLDEETLYLILSGEIGRPSKKNRIPAVKVSKAVYAKYFRPGQSAKEVQEVVEKALEFYFNFTENTKGE